MIEGYYKKSEVHTCSECITLEDSKVFPGKKQCGNYAHKWKLIDNPDLPRICKNFYSIEEYENDNS
jgi:hypothetical protein